MTTSSKCMSTPAVKICCISNHQEAQMAIELGASALGLVSEMPGGPGVISEELIADIAANVPEDINTFLLTSRQTADKIIAQHRRCKTNTLQLVDKVPNDDLIQLQRELPDIELVQVIHIVGEASIKRARNVAPYVDALLLDSGNPNLSVKELGGTGRTHNWKISNKIVQAVEKPVFLAGGLNPLNIMEALETVNPYGVDVCSGLRDDGTLSLQKAEHFFEQIETFKT